MENLPIDIHYNKLLDWLISRRHCKQQWNVASLIIREKINKALSELPENEEVQQLIKDTDVTYFHCQQIVDILKETSLGEKNVFGQYSSQNMKDLSNILRMYEKDSVYLAETSQMMARNVNYEIPALKKQVTKCQQIQKECDKKEAEFSKKAAEQRRLYDKKCKELGIKGDKIKSELSELVADVPKTFDEVASSSKDLKSSILYYQDFTSFLMGSKLEDKDCLPLLKLVQDRGNVTTYEWKYGTKPEHVEATSLVIDTTDENEGNTVQDVVEDIDWGDMNLDTSNTEADIDFDMSTFFPSCTFFVTSSTHGVQREDIDWGDMNLDTSNTETDIDFDISDITIESGGTDEGKGTIDLSVEQLGEEIDWGDQGNGEDVVIVEKSEAGVAAGEDALTLLDNPTTRNLFLDDLYELEAFLSQRLLELKGDDNFTSSTQMNSAPSSIQIDANEVETMLIDVRHVIEKFMSKQIQHLLLIRSSPRYVDRLRDSLKQLLTVADKMAFNEKKMVIKRNQASQDESEIQPSIDHLVHRTKEMKKQMEGEISKKYKDRQVNIIGEINTI